MNLEIDKYWMIICSLGLALGTYLIVAMVHTV